MVDVPPATPVTIPVAPTVATAVLLLLHPPPPVASESDVVSPAHTVLVPNIAVGNGVTVTTAVVVQPVAVEVKVMVVVPAAIALTTPPGLVIVATPGVLLVHVCAPAVASPSVVVFPTHNDKVPVIGASEFTVTTVVPVALIPHASVMVKVYVVVAPGVTVAGEPATGPGVQVKVYGGTPYVPAPVSVVDAPRHIVAGEGVAETNSTVCPITVITSGWLPYA